MAFPKLMRLLRYVEGEYAAPATFDRLRQALGDAAHPVHYLAIPQALFEDLRKGDQPGGRGPASARSLVTRPVHPVWWLAPSPEPSSPWKYS